MVPQMIWNTTILRWPVTVGLGTALERTMVEPHRIRRDMIFIGQHTGGHDLT